jgi:hypothetical protein
MVADSDLKTTLEAASWLWKQGLWKGETQRVEK